jgi:putative FmdB family regulatory protein
MPLYEYRCDACRHQFEVIQSFSAKPLRKCEKCGGKVRKLISRTGFVLKGGGWYKDAYGASPKASATESSPASSDAKAPAETKSEGSSSDAPAEKPAKSDAAPAKKKKAKG